MAYSKKMRTGVVLAVLLVVAAFVSQSEAGWGRRAWRRIKDAGQSAGDWAVENCRVGVSGPSCELSGRSVDEDVAPGNADPAN